MRYSTIPYAKHESSGIHRPFAPNPLNVFRPARLACAVALGLMNSWVLPAEKAFAELEEVTVTAQKHEEKLQDVPIAITAMNEKELQARGITNFEGIAASSPSMYFTPYSNSKTTFFLYMRGVGFIDPGQIAADGSIGLYLDGFYIARPQAITFDLGDLERVEILRGPQGTLYGRNTTGGAVNLIGKKPSGEFGFKQTLTFGNYNLFRSSTIIDLPEWRDVSAKISLLDSSVDGWTRNTGASHDFGEVAQRAGRLQLHWNATQDFYADYFGDYGELDSTPQYRQNYFLNGKQVIPGITYEATGRADRTYRPMELELSTARFEMHGLTLTWDVGDELTIKSLTGYRKLKDDAFQNYNEALAGANYILDALIKEHQFSQEFQFLGKALDNQINYVLGLYYFNEDASRDANTRFDLPAYSLHSVALEHDTAESTSKAIFAQLTWIPPILDDRLEITVGGRYTRDEKDATRTLLNNNNGTRPLTLIENGAPGDLSYSRFNPALTVNYHWTDELSTYAKVVTGYKAGASNALAPPGGFDVVFKPEKVTSYEIGMKSTWLDERARLNLALFQTKYRDKQAVIQVSPTVYYYDAFNIGEETIKGAELELTVTPVEDLVFGINYAWLTVHLDKLDAPAGTIYDPAVNPFSRYQVGQDVRNVFPAGDGYSPKNAIDLSADYTFAYFENGDLSLHLDYRWTDIRVGNGSAVPGKEYAVSPAYGLFNANLSLAIDLPDARKAKIIFWGKNILDEDKPLTRQGNGSPVQVSAAAPAGNTAVGGVPFFVEPRTFGVTLNYEY